MDFRQSVRQRFQLAVKPLTSRAAAAGISTDGLRLAVLAGAALVGLLLLTLPVILPGLHAVLFLLPGLLAVRAIALTTADQLSEQASGRAADPALREVTGAAGDVLLYLPLALYPGVPAVPVVVLVVLGLLAEVAGLAPLTRGELRREDGPMNQGDRAIVFAIVGLILALDPGTAHWLPWLLLPAAALAALTLVLRLRAAPIGG
jgi:hypothetical protein